MNGPKRRKGLRRGLSLLLTLCMVFTLLPAAALAADNGGEAPTPSAGDHAIYANGAALILAAGANTADGTLRTVIYIDTNGDGQVDEGEPIFTPNVADATDSTAAGNDLSEYWIYGGSESETVTGTSITMLGGTVAFLFGGGKSGAVNGNPTVTVSGGEVGFLCGGGDKSTVDGNPAVTVSGGKVGYLCGGGDNDGATVTGHPAVSVTGGKVMYLYGGGDKSTVNGNPSVTVSDGEVSFLYGGGGSGTVGGNPTVTVLGGTVGFLYGGGESTVNGSPTVTVSGGKVTSLYGGGFAAQVTGDRFVTVGGEAQIGDGTRGGVVINGGMGSVTDGVACFAIGDDLSSSAGVYVALPAGYNVTDSPTIATGAAEGDLAKIKLMGGGAAGKEAYLDGTDVKVRVKPTVSGAGGTIDSNTDQAAVSTIFGAGGATLTAGGSNQITLTDNVSLTGSVTFAGGDWSLDLAGHTLELLSGGGRAVELTGGSLRLTDSGATKGGITGDSYAIDQTGGALTLTDGVHLTAVENGYSAALYATAGAVTIEGAPVLTGGNYTLRVENTAQLILAAGAAPVCKGGNTGAWLNQAQDGLTISAGEFSGTDCGLEVGEELTNLTISGGTFASTDEGGGTGADLGSAATITGGTFTGDFIGLAAETAAAAATITGGTFTGGANGFGFASMAPAPISGGTFTGGLAGAYLGQPADDPATWDKMLSGGSFTFTGGDGGGMPAPSAISLVDGENTLLPIGGLPAAGYGYFAEGAPLELEQDATAVGVQGQAVTVSRTGGEAPALTVSGTIIYAGGTALILAAGRSDPAKTVIYIDKNGNGKIDTPDDVIFDPDGASSTCNGTDVGNDLSSYDICGGGMSALTADTRITMLGGKVNNLYGGSFGSDTTVTGNTTVAVSGGTVNDIYGGSFGSGATVTGNTTVAVVAGTVSRIYGGSFGSDATVGGDSSLTVGRAARIGSADGTGVIINGGTGSVASGVDSFKIEPDLAEDASVYVLLPEGYAGGVIATDAAAGDKDKLHLTGGGAAEMTLLQAGTTIKVGAASAPDAEYSGDGGKTWTPDSIGNAYINVSTGGTIRLLRDIDDTAIAMAKTFTLDLNGCRLSLTGSNTPLTVRSGSKLTLTDSVGGGSVTGGDGTESAAACPAVYVDSGGSLTLTGGKAFTLRGGNGYTSGSHTAGAAGVESHGIVTVSGTGAFLLQGGGGAANSNGGNGLSTAGALTATNPNAVFRGGKGGASAYGGRGAYVQHVDAATLSGGHFEGGDGKNGGYGLYLYMSSATVSGVTCTGGKGVSSDKDGMGLVLSAAVTVNSGLFSGRYGVNVYSSGQLTVTGGTFTGTTAGLYLNDSGSTAILQGGTFTGSENAYAVQTDVFSQKVSDLLGSGCAYFDKDGQQVAPGDATQLGQNAALRVAAAGSTPEPLYRISGTITDNSAEKFNGYFALMQDGAVIQRKEIVPNTYAFSYFFENVKPGTYTVVAVNYTGSPDNKTTKTATILVTVTDEDLTDVDFGWSANEIGAEVNVKPDTPPVSVGGLDKVVEDQGTTPQGDATVRLTAEKQDDPAGADQIVSVAGGKELEYLALTLELVVKESNGITTKIDLGDSNQAVLELVLPYDFTGKQNVTVYRHHGGTATALTALSGPPSTAVDGTFWADTANGYLHIYASKFSTYAVGYDEDGGGSHQSSSTTYYTLTATAGGGGSISPSGKVSVSRGGGKTFAIKPGEGYEIADVLVDGKSVGAVTSYTFENVTGAHTIAASFTKKAAWNPFADVKEGAWYYDSVKYAYENGLMVGTAGDKFSPGADTSRGMIVTILWRLEQEPKSGAAMAFTDVKAGSYYFDAIRWAAEHEIVKGYGNGNFGPNDPITRQELAAILYRYAQYKGMDVSAADDLTAFTDRPSPWAEDAVKWAVAKGILSGKGGGVLDSRGQATRAETAAMLMRFLQINP